MGYLLGLLFIIASIFYYLNVHNIIVEDKAKEHKYNLYGSVILIIGFVVILPVIFNKYFIMVTILGIISLILGIYLLRKTLKENK